MSLSDIVLLAVSFVVALIASWTVLLPFFSPGSAEVNTDQERLAEREAQQDQLLRLLSELESDLLEQKIAEDEYQRSREQLLSQAAAVYSEIEQIKTPRSSGAHGNTAA